MKPDPLAEVLIHLMPFTDCAVITVVSHEGKGLAQVSVPWTKFEELRAQATEPAPFTSEPLEYAEVH